MHPLRRSTALAQTGFASSIHFGYRSRFARKASTTVYDDGHPRDDGMDDMIARV